MLTHFTWAIHIMIVIECTFRVKIPKRDDDNPNFLSLTFDGKREYVLLLIQWYFIGFWNTEWVCTHMSSNNLIKWQKISIYTRRVHKTRIPTIDKLHANPFQVLAIDWFYYQQKWLNWIGIWIWLWNSICTEIYVEIFGYH